MRVRSLLAVLSLFASACTVLFPLDGLVPAESSEAGAGANDANDANDGARGDDGASDAPVDAAHGRYATEVLADAPLLYLRLGEKTGPSARDETQQRSPTYGGQVTFGAPGAILDDPDTAVTFTGTLDSTIVLPAGLDFAGTAPFTVEVWARRTTTTNEFGWAIDHQVYGNRNSWSVRFGKDLIAFERWADNNISGISTPFPLKLDAYQHVVGTFDGSVVALYVEGQMVQSGPSALSMKPMTTTWSLGAQNCGCMSSNFIGSLDELAVYDKALSAARILAHYHASGR